MIISDAFSTWDTVIFLAVVFVPVLLGAWVLHEVLSASVISQSYQNLPSRRVWTDHMENPSRTYVYDGPRTTVLIPNGTPVMDSYTYVEPSRFPQGSIKQRAHIDHPDCRCIHCRRGLTVVRATGSAGVY